MRCQRASTSARSALEVMVPALSHWRGAPAFPHYRCLSLRCAELPGWRQAQAVRATIERSQGHFFRSGSNQHELVHRFPY